MPKTEGSPFGVATTLPTRGLGLPFCASPFRDELPLSGTVVGLGGTVAHSFTIKLVPSAVFREDTGFDLSRMNSHTEINLRRYTEIA